MSQAVGTFATEGTQYSEGSSYYLLDTVPGPGNVLEGPITITGNLTTTGTTTTLGATSTPSLITSSVTALGALAMSSTVGNAVVTANSGGAARLVSGTNSVSADSNGVGMTTTGGSFGVLQPTGPFSTPSFTCFSYRNFNAATSVVTRTASTAITLTPSQFNPLRIGDISSAPISIPITPLFENGCLPKLVKLTMNNISFGSIFTGGCSVTQPFAIYFYQGNSTSWDVISSQALATFIYTNQTGTINTVGSTVTIPSVVFPPIHGSQISPTGGPITVWYFTYFQGFFGPPTGTQASFVLEVAL